MRHLIASILVVMFWGISCAASADELREFLNQNCLACHGAERQENDQRFDNLGNDFSQIETLVAWQGILDQLNLGEMPPLDSPQPAREVTSQFIERLTLKLKSAYAARRSTEGQTILRRLNRHELRNTFRDLFYLDGLMYRPGIANTRLYDNNGNGRVEHTADDPVRFFPADETESGSANIGEKLVMSDFLLNLIYGAADESIAAATHQEIKPKVETRRFVAPLYKRGAGELERVASEQNVKFDSLFRGASLKIDGLNRVGIAARYRISVEISAENQHHPWGELIPTQQDSPFLVSLELAKGRNQIQITNWEIPADGRIHQFSCESWIDGDWAPQLTWQNGPTSRELQTERLVKKYLQNQYIESPKQAQFSDKAQFDEARRKRIRGLEEVLLENYQGPLVKIHSLTLEPLVDSWPPKSHQMLYGNESGDEDEVRDLLFRFAERAFRRPVSKKEMAPYVNLVLKAIKGNRGGLVKDLGYRVYEGRWSSLPEFDALKPVAEGVFSSGLVDLNASQSKDYFGLVCEGKIKVPENGEYSFEMASDDGARILINNKIVVEHDGLHGAALRNGRVQLESGAHDLRIEYFAFGVPNRFRASWSGPGVPITPLSVDSQKSKNGGGALSQANGVVGALQDGYLAMLCSPQFIYRSEDSGSLGSYEIASRLSYFLWSSMPDETLFQLASKDQLNDPRVLAQQVDRMLDDEKAKSFVRNFSSMWLRLDKLGKMPPSEQFYRNLNVEQLMIEQVTRYFSDAVINNDPIKQFIDSKYTYMNDVLGKWIYRREDIRGSELRKMEVDDPRLGGIFVLPGVMTATANGVDTSPVVRGVWVLENVLGLPPSPPPPDVEPLPTDTRGAVTIREQLLLHRKHAACNGCHRKIDPMGFAFENFDQVGRWRDKYPRSKDTIDASATMANGRTVKDIVEFKQMLLTREKEVTRCLTEKLLSYSSGRLMEPVDRGEIDRIVIDLNETKGGVRDLIKNVVQSEIFLNK
ncbi:DUF1592 domain-containing protein [Mariniblastus sp.]|nr:DUF1592 domain-containing protein [Mariniblastus sp.]